MFILLVRSEKVGCRLFHATSLELLLKNLDWHRQQPYLAYMADELAFVQTIVSFRPQGYIVGKCYYLSEQEKLPNGELKFYDIHLTVDSGEWDHMVVRCLPVTQEEWDTERNVVYRTLDMVAGPNMPVSGWYHARTIYGTVICENIATLEECESLVRKYQTEVENQMCHISVERPTTQHLKTVDPYHEKSTHPGRGDAEVHQVTPGPDSTGLRNDSTQDSGAMCATGPEPGCEPPPDKDGGRQERTGDGGGCSGPTGAD